MLLLLLLPLLHCCNYYCVFANVVDLSVAFAVTDLLLLCFVLVVFAVAF